MHPAATVAVRGPWHGEAKSRQAPPPNPTRDLVTRRSCLLAASPPRRLAASPPRLRAARGQAGQDTHAQVGPGQSMVVRWASSHNNTFSFAVVVRVAIASTPPHANCLHIGHVALGGARRPCLARSAATANTTHRLYCHGASAARLASSSPPGRRAWLAGWLAGWLAACLATPAILPVRPTYTRHAARTADLRARAHQAHAKHATGRVVACPAPRALPWCMLRAGQRGGPARARSLTMRMPVCAPASTHVPAPTCVAVAAAVCFARGNARAPLAMALPTAMPVPPPPPPRPTRVPPPRPASTRRGSSTKTTTVCSMTTSPKPRPGPTRP